MPTSILNSIKHALGVPEDYTVFDQDIIMHINTVLGTLHQLGVKTNDDFAIEGVTETWEDYIPPGPLIKSVPSFVYVKVRLIFDPPSTSFTIEAFERIASELEFRINVQAEGAFENEPV